MKVELICYSNIGSWNIIEEIQDNIHYRWIHKKFLDYLSDEIQPELQEFKLIVSDEKIDNYIKLELIKSIRNNSRFYYYSHEIFGEVEISTLMREYFEKMPDVLYILPEKVEIRKYVTEKKGWHQSKGGPIRRSYPKH
jgi:hypothetical protein